VDTVPPHGEMKMKKLLATIPLLLTMTVFLSGCAPRAKTPLVVFAAGSLIQPFADIEKAFEAENPDIDVQCEFHGSIQVMRHVTDIHEKIDVVATADYNLIPMLMEAATDPESGKPYSDWYIRFATNRLGIAYTEKSRYASEINAQNWVEILLRPDVRLGLADPRFDAAGYRSLMVFKLGEQIYQKPGLFFDMFYGAFKFPVKTSEENGHIVIHIPEVLETRPASRIVMRGGSIQLNALLEAGEIDYAFEYESVINQLGFKMVALPDRLNLGSPEQADFYSQITALLDFQRFASVKPEFRGGQIGYGITIPTNAPHPNEAVRFLAFLFGAEGAQILQADHHPLLNPLKAHQYDRLPNELKLLVISD